MQQQFSILPVKFRVHHNEGRVRVPIVRVVRGELVIPFHITGCRIERQHAIRKQVIAAALAIVRIRIWISSGPEERIGFGIV